MHHVIWQSLFNEVLLDAQRLGIYRTGVQELYQGLELDRRGTMKLVIFIPSKTLIQHGDLEK